MTEELKTGVDTADPEEKARQRRHTQRKLDDALEDSFPASDPPSITQPPPTKEDKKPANQPG
jgi:hypothetical protein